MNDLSQVADQLGHTQNIKRILANTSLFRMLNEQELDEICSGTEPLRVRPNASIVDQGEAPRGMFLMVYGHVNICFVRNDGSEKSLAILGPNKCFGLSEMILDRAHLASVRTLTHSMLLHISRSKVMEVAQRNFGFAEEIMTCVGRQLYTLVRDIESYSLQTAKQRVAAYLLRQSQYQGSMDIELPVRKTVIASRLSMTPESLSRLLNELSATGVLSVSGRHIRISDFEKLVDAASM